MPKGIRLLNPHKLLLAALSLACLPAWAKDEPSAAAQDVWHEPVTGMVFVQLPKACYQMGAKLAQEPQADYFWDRTHYPKDISTDERPVHEVCLGSFWIGKYEVRADEWQSLMGTAVPVPTNGALPATGISWQMAAEFAQKMTAAAQGKWKFRLPTEAEWEFACRGGEAADADSPSTHYQEFAWSYAAKAEEPQVVGLLIENRFGLHDMLGNVWEWTQDNYHHDGYAKHTLYNPKVMNPAAHKVLRGGSILTENVQVRCAMRGHAAPSTEMGTFGFRLVRE